MAQQGCLKIPVSWFTDVVPNFAHFTAVPHGRKLHVDVL